MTYVNLKMPVDIARDYLKSQLGSYAYNKNNGVIVYLNTICYGDSGNITDIRVQAYPVEEYDDILKLFTSHVNTLIDMEFIDTDLPSGEDETIKWIEEKNAILNRLEEFKRSSTTIDVKLPMFSNGSDSEQAPASKQFNPIDDITPADIEVDLFNGSSAPPEYITELDGEIL